MIEKIKRYKRESPKTIQATIWNAEKEVEIDRNCLGVEDIKKRVWGIGA